MDSFRVCEVDSGRVSEVGGAVFEAGLVPGPGAHSALTLHSLLCLVRRRLHCFLFMVSAGLPQISQRYVTGFDSSLHFTRQE